MSEKLQSVPADTVPSGLRGLSSALTHEGMITRVSPMGLCYVFEEGTGEVYSCATELFPREPKLGSKVRFRIVDAAMTDPFLV